MIKEVEKKVRAVPIGLELGVSVTVNKGLRFTTHWEIDKVPDSRPATRTEICTFFLVFPFYTVFSAGRKLVSGFTDSNLR